jgi:hypothetical protein
MLRINLKYFLIVFIFFGRIAFSFTNADLSSEIQITNSLNKIEKYILDNEIGVKNDMIRAHVDVSLILTEFQKSCLTLKDHPYKLLENICSGIGNMMYESMARQNYFIRTYFNLRIYILPMDPPIQLGQKSPPDVNRQRYLFFNLIDWVNLNPVQKRIQVLLELMNFNIDEHEGDSLAAAAIYYGIKTSGLETTAVSGLKIQNGNEVNLIRADDKLFLASTNSKERKSSIYIEHKDYVESEIKICSAFRNYPISIWAALEKKFSSSEICQFSENSDDPPKNTTSIADPDLKGNLISFSERLKIFRRCEH